MVSLEHLGDSWDFMFSTDLRLGGTEPKVLLVVTSYQLSSCSQDGAPSRLESESEVVNRGVSRITSPSHDVIVG
jgi:hypothetical protein